MTRVFSDDVSSLLANANDAMVELRHELHSYPELSFQEHRTTKVIRDRLAALGWQQGFCPTETGAVATLEGGRPGKTVMIRADIDALPVQEEGKLSFASRNEGVMHACGHDVHTAAALGVADVLSQRRDDLAGNFILLFQPAEEGFGGAHAMIEGGVLKEHRADFVIGAHVTSLAPVGFVGTRPGIMMSEAQSLAVTIKGKGGHGAMASSEGNVVLAVSSLAPRLGEVVDSLSYEGTNCACSAGVIHAGTANNVVPRSAQLKGTLRTFTPEQHLEAIRRLRSLLDDVASAFGVSCDLDLEHNTPAVRNDVNVAHRVLESASTFAGPSNVMQFPPASPSDDMSEFLNRIPGCYMFVGGAMSDGSSGMHHSPDFSVDDASCRMVAGVLANCAVDLAQG